MNKKEKEQLKEISENLLVVVKKLDNYCDKQVLCKKCPLNMEYMCCLRRSQTIYNNLTTLLKELKNGQRF